MTVSVFYLSQDTTPPRVPERLRSSPAATKRQLRWLKNETTTSQ